jgi:hypothetical protein
MKRKKHPQNEQTRREAGLPGVSKEIRGGAAKRLPSYGMPGRRCKSRRI